MSICNFKIKLYIFLLVGMLTFFFLTTSVKAENSNFFLYLNEKKNVSVSSGQFQCYTYTPQTNQFFVVETYGDYDTKLRIENTAIGTIIDDNSGEGMNSRIYFQAVQNQTLTIYTKINGYGSATYQLQIRKQSFSMFAYVDSNGNSTIPDLTVPYNNFNSIFNCYQYENTSASYALDNDERFLSRINCEIMFFSGHGVSNGSSVVFYDGSTISNNDLFDMSRTKVAVWAACYSAYDNNSLNISIAEHSEQRGATSSVGFEKSIDFSSSRTFTNRFFSRLSSNYTVKQSAVYGANGLLWPWDNAKKYKIFGEEDLIVTSSTISNSSFYTGSRSSSNIPFLDYICVKNENISERYYELINGCLSCNVIDIYYENGVIIDVEEHVLSYNEILPQDKTILSNEEELLRKIINYKNFNSYKICDKNIVYYVINGKMTPIMITSIDIDNGDLTKQEFVCINLNTGDEISYTEINSI